VVLEVLRRAIAATAPKLETGVGKPPGRGVGGDGPARLQVGRDAVPLKVEGADVAVGQPLEKKARIPKKAKPLIPPPVGEAVASASPVVPIQTQQPVATTLSTQTLRQVDGDHYRNLQKVTALQSWYQNNLTLTGAKVGLNSLLKGFGETNLAFLLKRNRVVTCESGRGVKEMMELFDKDPDQFFIDVLRKNGSSEPVDVQIKSILAGEKLNIQGWTTTTKTSTSRSCFGSTSKILARWEQKCSVRCRHADLWLSAGIST